MKVEVHFNLWSAHLPFYPSCRCGLVVGASPSSNPEGESSAEPCLWAVGTPSPGESGWAPPPLSALSLRLPFAPWHGGPFKQSTLACVNLCPSRLWSGQTGCRRGMPLPVSPGGQSPTGGEAHLRAPRGPGRRADDFTCVFTAPPGPEFLTSTPTCLCSQREWGPGHRQGSPGVQLVILNKLSLCGQITHSCPPLFLLLFTLHYLCDLRKLQKLSRPHV